MRAPEIRDAAHAVLRALGSPRAEELLQAAGVAHAARVAEDLAVLARTPALAPVVADVLERALAGPDPEAVVRNLRRLVDAGGVLDPPALDLAVPLFAHSAEAARFFVREPAELRRLAASPYLRAPRSLASMREELADLGEDLDGAMAALRRFRRREHARIAWRDVTGAAPMEELLPELSDVAEAVLEAATRVALAAVAAEEGPPLRADGAPCGFAVLGLGKLGGRELNFSSDVDLLFLYETDEGGAAGGRLTLHEIFARAARLITRIVGEKTDDGFAFRVDLDLRPEGKKGAIVNSVASLERYYETWGQVWERAALIKARPVAGDRALGERALRALVPFVFPRSIAPSAVEEVRALKARIDASEQRRGAAWNSKLGRGGIREIELFVQAHQLLLAGKRERLRLRGTLESLRALAEEGVLPEAVADSLRCAYLFLRRLEHRLQIAEGQQVHRLPEALADRARLARGLGLWQGADDTRAAAALQRELLRHRRVVMAAFDGLFHGAPGGGADLPPSLAGLFDALPGAPVPKEARATLRTLGLRDPVAAYAHLAHLARTPGTPFHPRSPARVRALAGRFLGALPASPDPDLALRHACDFLLRLRGRLGSYALLAEHPATLRTLLDLFGTSDFLARLVVQRPELLDPLIIGVVGPRRTRADLSRDLRTRTAGADDEARLDTWRRFHADEILRIGLSDVSGRLDLCEVQAELSALAEALVDEALAWGLETTTARLGAPPGPLCVVGMGKLGGAELNYNSDLDLLFLYSAEGEGSGSSQEFFARVAQKLLFGLSCATSEGFLYRIDARLRPSGRQGSLVSSIRSFAQYHEASARVWERLALTRARPVAGPPDFQVEAKLALERAAYGKPLPPGGAREVDRLRQRMEIELAREDETRYNVKLGRGGLVDVEFATQLLQLRVGGEHPEVRRPGTLDALAALLAADAWDAGDLFLLREAYLFLRRLENRLRIVHDNAQSVLSRDPHAVEVVARRMGFAGGGRVLLSAYEETTAAVRDVYGRIVEAMP